MDMKSSKSAAFKEKTRRLLENCMKGEQEEYKNTSSGIFHLLCRELNPDRNQNN